MMMTSLPVDASSGTNDPHSNYPAIEQPPQDGSVASKNYDTLEQSSDTSPTVNTFTEAPIDEVFPEGGYGWWVILSCFISQFIVIGPSYVYGVFLPHYTQTFPHTSLATLTTVGTLQSATMSLLGPLSGSLASKIGYRSSLFLGNIIVVLSLIAVSFATQVWHLFLFQGFLYGLGASLIYLPCISAPSHWFSHRRGLVMGITVAGAGLGGLALAPLFEASIKKIGIGWTFRAHALVSFILVTMAGLLMKLPPTPTKVPVNNLGMEKGEKLVLEKKNAFRKFLLYHLLRNQQFYLISLMTFILGLGFLAPFHLLSSYAISIGLLSWQGALITGLLCGSDAIGKIIIGFSADHLGHINSMIICMFIGALSCGILWPLSLNLSTLVIFAITYGFCEGGFITLLSVVCADLFGVEHVSIVLGIVNLSFGITTLMGTPLITAIKQSSGSFSVAFRYSGLMILIAAISLCLVRFTVTKKICYKV